MKLFYILKKAKKGCETSILEIYNRFNLTIKKFSKKMGYEEAETDLIIVLLELIKKIDLDNIRIKKDGGIVNYIYSYLENRSVDLFKKNVLKVIETTSYESYMSPIVDNTINIVFNILIYNLIGNLPLIQRKVIIGKFFYGYTDVEMASMYKKSRQAINRAKNRGLKNLRKSLLSKEQ